MMFVAKNDWQVLKDLFKQCDTDNSGTIDIEEMKVQYNVHLDKNKALLDLIKGSEKAKRGV